MNKDINKEDLFKDTDFIYWYRRWTDRLKNNKKSIDLSIKLMKEVNPLIIPRNHKVEEALNAINNSENLDLFYKLLKILEKPYEDQVGSFEYKLAPDEDKKNYKTYCGT